MTFLKQAILAIFLQGCYSIQIALLGFWLQNPFNGKFCQNQIFITSLSPGEQETWWGKASREQGAFKLILDAVDRLQKII